MVESVAAGVGVAASTKRGGVRNRDTSNLSEVATVAFLLKLPNEVFIWLLWRGLGRHVGALAGNEPRVSAAV
jgi:hypothetical protein